MNPSGPNIDKIEEAAKGGDAKAAYDLGWCYYIGNGVAQDTSKAFYWYTEAASCGSREAAETLHVLEVEAQREAELEYLRQSDAHQTHGRRPRMWLPLMAVVLVSVVSVSLVRYVFKGEPSALRKQGSVIGDASTMAERPTTSDVMGRTLIDSEKKASLEQNEVLREETLATVTPAGARDEAIPAHKAADQGTRRDLQGEKSHPNDLLLPAEPVRDYSGLVEFAKRWLGEANDVETFE